MDVARGYERGGQRVLELLAWAQGVPELETITLWPLSTENLDRDDGDLEPLLSVIATTTEQIAATGAWCTRVIGCPDRLPADLRRRVQRAVDATRGITAQTVNIAIAYGGRDEIVRAAARMAADQSRAPTSRNASVPGPTDFSAYLDTAGQPDPDMIIRTSGEQRLSGFMLWQAAYAELYFCPALWPDFTRDDCDQALAHYRARSRNFGR